ncbi:hypothetical protein Bca4012_025918 [Brassica carinata]
MFAKSTPRQKRNQNPAGSRRRSTADKPREQLHTAKQARYQVSESEASQSESDNESGGGGSSSSAFPSRLFAADAYPTALCLNIYSKANVIGAVAAALEGSPALERLLRSQFRKLFELPVVRCHNSTKLVASLLCRQLVTLRGYELWFTFATHPLRFSLDEFHDVTGLNCGAFDVHDSEAGESPASTMWNKLFDTTLGTITVGDVLEMLRNPNLAEWKRLPLALIALVDGVVCCSNKNLKLSPKYVEMLSDVESFLAYPWGRASFLATLPRFLPPPVSKTVEDPLEAMREWLSQKTTACYGFPLALQLFAFECVPLLLEKIPDASRNATFLDDPTACANSVTILTVQDVVAVEKDPDLTVSFTVTPDEERLLLLDEVEDSQVTSLVRKLRSGEPFEVEDFPGGDSSFSPKLEIKDAGGLVKDEKLGPDPVYQRSLRPRKAVPVEIEDISSSGDSEQAVPPCSGRCTHEDLKPFFLAQFQKISNQISNQMGEMERNIRRGLGLPEGTIHNSRKRKGGDDHHGQTSSPDSIGLETQETNRKGKRKKTGVSASVGKIQSYSLRRGGGDDVSQVVQQSRFEPRRNNPAAAHRETLAKNVSGKGLTARPFQNKPQQETRTPSSGNDEHPQQNDSDNARMPPTFGNVTDQDAQQQQTPSNALILYRNPLCVQPRSYVLPPEKPSTLHFEVEGGSPVAWEKTNPHIYRSVRSVRSFHSPRRGNLDSKAKVASTGSGNQTSSPIPGKDGPRKDDEPVKDQTAGPLENPSAKDTGTPNDVEYDQQDEDVHEQFVEQVRTGTEENEIPSHDSGQKSNLVFPMYGEKLHKGPSPNVDVGQHDPPIVDANNEEIPALDEDERYDNCRDDMSTDNQMQENRVNQVSETEEDSNVVAGGGKRQRTRSRKLTGVYTAESRLKKLFDSAKKVETFKISTGHCLSNSFFLDVAELRKWLTDEIKMHTN